ncbi:hypothetical protein HN020_09215 [Brevibacillus borstelensis]|jgi:hypothetical protein|uniref:hypothetical protein n=1 Tax=Brevibacillus borstelensis TaxID=45462 RepID=UPI000469D310|nr:hypothetical protein [Brevibacillus borstelensis]NOU54927.1 hypothetical protein [Brevibacillus borstelensis]
MYCTVESIKTRFVIVGDDEDTRIRTIIEQQSILIDQRLSVPPDSDPALAIILPIAAEEICAGEYLLAVAGENAIDGILDFSILKLGPDPDKIARLAKDLVANGWDKMKAWLKPDIPVFVGYFSGVDG